MKLLIAFLIIINSVACNCTKKTQQSNTETTAESVSGSDNTIREEPMSPFGVFFTSMASGPADDAFLKEWVTGYIKEKNISGFSADVYTGCGKEGEYTIIMDLSKESFPKVLAFRAGLEDVVKKQGEKNKAANPSSGPINIEYGVTKDRYQYCRLGSKKWL